MITFDALTDRLQTVSLIPCRAPGLRFTGKGASQATTDWERKVDAHALTWILSCHDPEEFYARVER